MPDILQILADDHANMRALMQLLETEIDKMADGGSADVGTISAVAEYLLEYPDRFHHPVEDLLIQGMQAAGAVPGSSVEALEADGWIGEHNQAEGGNSSATRAVMIEVPLGVID